MLKEQKKLNMTLSELVVKMSVMILTTGIGLFCGATDSYESFYIAVFMQSINNMYDSFPYLQGYTKFITTFHLLSFIGSLAMCLLSAIYFFSSVTTMESNSIVIIFSIILSVPIIFYGIEIINMEYRT